MKKQTTLLTIATLPVIAGTFLASAGVTPVHAYQTCDENTALNEVHGTVTKNSAVVYNNATNCEAVVTLAIYDAPIGQDQPGWIEAQKLIDHKTITVAPGDKTTISGVNDQGQDCLKQADLIRGSEVLDTPTYRMAISTDVYKTCGESNATPTPTCTATPTVTPTPGATATPTPGATATPTPAGKVAGLASTGNAVAMAALIFAGVISLIGGLVLRRAGK